MVKSMEEMIEYFKSKGACGKALKFLSSESSWSWVWQDRYCYPNNQKEHFEWRMWVLTTIYGKAVHDRSDSGRNKYGALYSAICDLKKYYSGSTEMLYYHCNQLVLIYYPEAPQP